MLLESSYQEKEAKVVASLHEKINTIYTGLLHCVYSFSEKYHIKIITNKQSVGVELVLLPSYDLSIFDMSNLMRNSQIKKVLFDQTCYHYYM